MRGLQRLPGFQRSSPGLEWAVWRRLPALLAWGTALPGALALALWMAAPEVSATAAEREQWLWIYRLIGLVVLHWTLLFTLAIGCVIVMLMKGPAYVADAYPPPDREPSR
jgi:hypothetical protein